MSQVQERIIEADRARVGGFTVGTADSPARWMLPLCSITDRLTFGGLLTVMQQHEFGAFDFEKKRHAMRACSFFLCRISRSRHSVPGGKVKSNPD